MSNTSSEADTAVPALPVCINMPSETFTFCITSTSLEYSDNLNTSLPGTIALIFPGLRDKASPIKAPVLIIAVAPAGVLSIVFLAPCNKPKTAGDVFSIVDNCPMAVLTPAPNSFSASEAKSITSTDPLLFLDSSSSSFISLNVSTRLCLDNQSAILSFETMFIPNFARVRSLKDVTPTV